MNEKKKIIFVIVSGIIAVIIAAGLYYYLAFVNNNTKNSTDDMNNPAYIAEMNNTNNNVNKKEEIEKSELVDSKVNDELSAKIEGYVKSLDNVKVDSIKIYKASTASFANSLNQESTYNNIENNVNATNSNNGNINSNNSGVNRDTNDSNQSENVNVILDLTLKPSSDNMETVRQDMETKANNLAVSIANEKPNIMTAIVNFGVDGKPNAKASFTFERSGSNMFLQEFMMSSEFN